MRKTSRSFGFAVTGLAHAVATERNLQLFIGAHVVITLLGFFFQILTIEWILIVIFGGIFMIVELLNTALERLADTVDDGEKKRRGGHYSLGIKATKDVGAAASLVALSLDIAILLIIFLPPILRLLA